DIENDQKSGKITIAVRLGLNKARFYHYALIYTSIVFFTLFSVFMFVEWYQFIFLAPLILLLQHVSKVKKRSSYKEFNPLLKELSLKSALTALSIGFGYII
ncbi:MAG: prenyltransferase, partial [Bacteroidia bacterium]